MGSVYVMIGSTKIKKGSKYGTEKDNQNKIETKSNPNNNFDNESNLRMRSNVN